VAEAEAEVEIEVIEVEAEVEIEAKAVEAEVEVEVVEVDPAKVPLNSTRAVSLLSLRRLKFANHSYEMTSQGCFARKNDYDENIYNYSPILYTRCPRWVDDFVFSIL